jgi:hypothetical protein
MCFKTELNSFFIIIKRIKFSYFNISFFILRLQSRLQIFIISLVFIINLLRLISDISVRKCNNTVILWSIHSTETKLIKDSVHYFQELQVKKTIDCYFAINRHYHSIWKIILMITCLSSVLLQEFLIWKQSDQCTSFMSHPRASLGSWEIICFILCLLKLLCLSCTTFQLFLFHPWILLNIYHYMLFIEIISWFIIIYLF